MNHSVTSLVTTKTMSQRRWIVGLLLAVWLGASYGILTHKHDHPLANDIHCQFCLSSFINTPITLDTALTIPEIRPYIHTELENFDAQDQAVAYFTLIRAPPF